MNRDDLNLELRTGRDRLDAILAEVDASRAEDVVLHGDWSVKDLLGHLAFWELRVQDIFHTLVDGKVPESVSGQAGVDAINHLAYEKYHPRPFAEVRQLEGEAYHSLLKMVAGMSDAELFDPAHFPWTRGQPFSDWILGNAAGHYEEHLPELMDWLGKISKT